MKMVSRALLLFALVAALSGLSVREANAEIKFGPDAASYYSATNAVEDQWIQLLTAGGATNRLNGPFVDASLGLDDNATTLVDIGFNFNFYGNVYTKVYINLNGFLIFEPLAGSPTPANSDLTRNLAPLGSGGTPNPDGTPYVLWTDVLPNALVAPFCANLNFNNAPSATLLSQTVGSGNNKIFIVQWTNVPLYNSPNDTTTMQIQLHANGFIYFVYQSVPDSLADTTSGSRWTGLENEQGTVGLTYTNSQHSNPNLRVPYQLTSGLNLFFYSNQDTVKLSIVSPYGNPSPPVGDQVPRPENSLVTALVEPNVGGADGIRFRCTGWVGTGSAPGSWDGTGAPNFIVFEIEEDTTISWQWIQEFRIKVTSLGNNGNPIPPEGDNWYSSYAQVEFSVTTPFQAWNCDGYTGTGDIGVGTGSSFFINVTQPSTIIWNWSYAGGLLSLGVISPFGIPTPNGLSLYTPGQQITATVAQTVDVGGVIYTCTHSNGTGSAPGYSPGNSVTFTILQNSTITWVWQDQSGGTLLLTVHSPFPPIPGRQRLFNQEYVYVSAQSPVEGDGYRWVCTGFTSAGSSIQAPTTASSFTFLMNQPTTINFLWEIYYRLDVTSGDGEELFGNPQLSVGGGPNFIVLPESWWSSEMPFLLSVTSPYVPADSDGVRYTCLGWEGSEEIPQTQHDTTTVAFFLTSPIDITFLWQAEYQFTVFNPRNLPGPSPSVGSYWYPANALVSGNSIREVGFYTCVGFDGEGSLEDSTDIEFAFNIDAPTSIEWLWELDLPAFSATDVIDPSTTGLYTSLARESDTGYPWIAFFDSDLGDLVVMNYNGTQWVRKTVATIGTTGQYASLILDNINAPHIAYYDATNGDLYYAHWTGVNWERILVDSEGDVGRYAKISLITSASGIVPSIAYYDATNRVLKYAERSGAGFALQTVTVAGSDRGKFCSLAFDGFRNIPTIAYYDATNGDLMYASRIGGVWGSDIVHSVGDVGRFASLSFNADNEPGIAYYDLTNRDLKFVQRSAGQWLTPITVDSNGDVGQFCSLVFTANNIPMISYADYGREALKFAFFTGIEWTDLAIDSDGNNVGWYSSIALDAYGNPGISYATATTVRYKSVPTPTAPQNPDGGTQNIATAAGSSGCFIATSAFGTMSASTVESLCGMRDNSLRTSFSGYALTSLYYSLSPCVASDMRMSSSVRAMVRALLSGTAK